MKSDNLVQLSGFLTKDDITNENKQGALDDIARHIPRSTSHIPRSTSAALQTGSTV